MADNETTPPAGDPAGKESDELDLTPDEDETPSETPDEDETPDADDEETLGEGGVKALKAERKARKALEATVTTLRTETEALRTELDDLKAAKAKADADAAATDRALRIHKTLSESGLDSDLADLITGETDDEITSQVERLSNLTKANRPGGSLLGERRDTQPKHSAESELGADLRRQLLGGA